MTQYYAVVRFHDSGAIRRYVYASDAERALFLFGLAKYVEILEEGTSELRDEPAEQTP